MFKKLKDGKELFFTSTLVVAEVIWNLEKGYKISKNEVIPTLQEIINTPNLHIDEKEILLVALGIYKVKNIDFVDVYNAAVMAYKDIKVIYSYDKHYDQISGIKILQP